MKHLMNFLKGIAIGIANIIPGFSGGTMAVMLKVYDLFVYAFAHIFDDFINVIKKSWSLFVGIVTGVVLGTFAIVKLLEVIPFITIMFFVGLIIGTLPQIFSRAKPGKITLKDVISLLVAIALIVVLPLLNTSHNIEIQFDFKLYVILLLLGVVCSSAMVIPGVSGSLVLMAFGYYDFLMEQIVVILKNLFHFSMDNYWGIFFACAVFAIGCIVGIVFISRLIEKLMAKFPKTVYCAILGLLLASPFSIIYAILTSGEYSVTFTLPTILFSILSCIAGVALVIGGEQIMKRKQLESSEK